MLRIIIKFQKYFNQKKHFIIRFHFREKSQAVISYADKDIVFLYLKSQPFIHSHILEFTCEKCYVFQKLLKVFYSNEMLLNVALYQKM